MQYQPTPKSKLEDAPRLLKIPKSECPDVWIRLPRHKWPKSWANIEDSRGTSWTKFVWSSTSRQDCYGKDSSRKFWLELGWEKVLELGMSVCSSKTRIILIGFTWMIFKMAGKKQNMAPMWKNLMKRWSWRTISFLVHVHLRQYSTWMQTEWNYYWGIRVYKMSESRISAGATETLPRTGKSLTQRWWRGPTIPHGRTCSKKCCWAILRAGKQESGAALQSFKSVLGWSSIQTGQNLNQSENYHKYRSQIVLQCLYLARIGRPDILWSVNKLARAVTKWTQACDRRLARLISHIHHTHDIPAILSCRSNTAQHCRVGLFRRLRLCWRPWGLEINLGESLMYLWKPNICPHQLDVQETNVSIPQFYRVWNHFFGCWIAHGWTTCSRSLGSVVIEVLRSTNDTARQATD